MGTQSPSWVAWNIFLATVPVAAAYLLAYWTEQARAWQKGAARLIYWLVWLPLVLVWFAFLPNTCYLLTEWRHFLFDPYFTSQRGMWDESANARLTAARYGLYFLVYSGIGVICYALSIRPIERRLRRTHPALLLIAIPFFFLTSLGVYMGLIRRLNSWQVLSNPQIVWDVALHALTSPRLLKIIVIFAFLLWLLYEIVDVWIDGMALRYRRISTGGSRESGGSAASREGGSRRRSKSGAS